MFSEIVLSTVFSLGLSNLMQNSGKHAVLLNGKQNPPGTVSGAWLTKDKNMSGSYEIVGRRNYDDILGAIGADLLIGNNDDLLESLISGLGNTEIVGAASPGGKAKTALQQALVEKVLAKNAGAVVTKELNTRRRYPLGFVPTNLATGITTTIPAGPQNLFRSERLIVPSDIAFDLDINDVKVGNQSQLVQAVSLPAAMFTEVAIDTQVTFDTAEVGNQISATFFNNSGGTVRVAAGLIGTIAKS